MRKVLVIGLVIAVIQQITGINAVFFYAPMIFEQSGIGTNAAFSQAVLVGLINLVFTFVAIGLVDKLGRKPLLAVGLLGITISMLVLGLGFKSATYTLPAAAAEGLPESVDPSSLSPLVGQTFYSDVAFKRALAEALGAAQAAQLESELIKQSIHVNSRLILFGILGFVASFAFSVGPVMWVLFSELFPNRVRGLAISFVGFVNSAVSFTVQLVFPWELANFGSATTFLIYAGFAAIGFFFVLALLPETKGRSLEELAEATGQTAFTFRCKHSCLMKTPFRNCLHRTCCRPDPRPARSVELTLALALSGLVATGTSCQAASPAAVVKVELRQTDGQWRLYRDGEPFYIKGAGIEHGSIEKLREHGGNSFRTWSTDNGRDTGKQVLDRALANGLCVAMGLDVDHERRGFDYDDTNAVAKQFELLKSQVLEYKDHPALLLWVVGNELNFEKNPKVWDAVNDLSRMIHEVDPNHPTTTTLAGFNPETVHLGSDPGVRSGFPQFPDVLRHHQSSEIPARGEVGPALHRDGMGRDRPLGVRQDGLGCAAGE